MSISNPPGNLSMLGVQVQGPAYLGVSIAPGKSTLMIGPRTVVGNNGFVHSETHLLPEFVVRTGLLSRNLCSMKNRYPV
jgi:hypothetical protein